MDLVSAQHRRHPGRAAAPGARGAGTDLRQIWTGAVDAARFVASRYCRRAGGTRAPRSAASIAQVHVATLKDGREVVVKILRPGMREVIDLDLEVLDYLAELADEYWADARRLRPVDLVREYRKN